MNEFVEFIDFTTVVPLEHSFLEAENIKLKKSNGLLKTVCFSLVVLLVGTGVYIYLKKNQDAATEE